ncbi:MAG: fluoride efflux transporter CrcB [Sediminibacterium sp.]|nr:fluoride efflux transporter CrcB [Sediminibacterium sp.]
MLKNVLLIGFGGFCGTISRYYLKIFITNHVESNFPFGIFLINVLGSFILGFLTEWWLDTDSSFILSISPIFIIGFCGGFTTFSTLSFDSLILFQEGYYWKFFLNSVGSLICGILAVFAGMYLGRQI